MADDKIRISWEDVNSSQVDAKLKQQEALARAQEHYQQSAPPVVPMAALPGITRASIWYNSLFYMALFGLLGGLAAWLAGELTHLVLPDTPLQVYDKVLVEVNKILERQQRGLLSEQQAQAAIYGLLDAHRDNPYVAIDLDQSLNDDVKQRRIVERAEKDSTRWDPKEVSWCALVAGFLALGLAIADPVVGRNWNGVIISGSVGFSLGLLGGLIASLFINRFYHSMGGAN